MTYSLFKRLHKEASDKLEEASHRMKQFNEFRLPNGLTPDHIKALPEWKEAKAKFTRAFSELRELNKTGRKFGYLKMMAKERRDNREK